MHTIKTRLTHGALIILLPCLVLGSVVGMNFALPRPAYATGTHCAWWGILHIAGYTLPTGQYCFTVMGSGTTVRNTLSSYNTFRLINASERIRFYDNWNNNYATYNTYNSSGNSYGFHGWYSNIQGQARVGRACGELMSSGIVIAETCNAIE